MMAVILWANDTSIRTKHYLYVCMSTVKILTLFGEEILVPEQIGAVGKSRTRKKKATTEETATTPNESKKKKLPIEDWVADKQYYSIGEVADLFLLRTSHIRYWTTEFNIKARTTRKGDRLYSPSQIEELRTIYILTKEKKFTISGAKNIFKQNKKSVQDTHSLRQSLLRLRNQLATLNDHI